MIKLVHANAAEAYIRPPRECCPCQWSFGGGTSRCLPNPADIELSNADAAPSLQCSPVVLQGLQDRGRQVIYDLAAPDRQASQQTARQSWGAVGVPLKPCPAAAMQGEEGQVVAVSQ